MPGLDYPRIRRASPKNFAVLATALQSRPTALFFGPWDSRIAPPSTRAAPTPEALFRPRKSSGGAPRNERTSPRVHPLGPCRLNAVNFCGAQESELQTSCSVKLGVTAYARAAVSQMLPECPKWDEPGLSGTRRDGVRETENFHSVEPHIAVSPNRM